VALRPKELDISPHPQMKATVPCKFKRLREYRPGQSVMELVEVEDRRSRSCGTPRRDCRAATPTAPIRVPEARRHRARAMSADRSLAPAHVMGSLSAWTETPERRLGAAQTA